jgi:hypothetical protein
VALANQGVSQPATPVIAILVLGAIAVFEIVRAPGRSAQRGGKCNVGPCVAAAGGCQSSRHMPTWLAPHRRASEGPQAGLTSPTLRLSATISPEERPLTTLISPPLTSALPRCFVVASIAPSTDAIATLKYWKDGAANTTGPSQRGRSTPGGASGAGTVCWTTQPAGDDLSLMCIRWHCSGCSTTPCQGQ